jgi:hypothetical protein
MVDYAIGTVAFQDTGGVLTSFPNVIEKTRVRRAGKETGEPKYSANFEFEPNSEDLKRIKAAIVAVLREAVPGVDLNQIGPVYKIPLENGDRLADKAKEKADKEKTTKMREWSRGKAVLTARTTTELELSAIVNGQYREFPDRKLAKPFFYTGVFCGAEVLFKYYDAVDDNGKPGVTCYLQKIISLNKGTKLTAGTSGADVFKHYVGIQSNESVLDEAQDIAF